MEYINMDKRFKISKTLIIYFIFLLLFILAISKPNDAYGYDSANSCSTQESKQSRRGRAQMLAAIPCDLTRQVYCHLPGSAYPWHAVRRFVHENHGLMKRMYGDVRHISVLRDEIFNNEIDTDDFEDVAERYSKNPHRERSAKYMHAKYEEYGSVKSNGDALTEPHFRQVSTTTKTTTAAPVETTREESASVTNEKKEVNIKDEYAGRIAGGGAGGGGGTIRRRVNATTNGGGGHRRRINVYINRNRPLHSSLRRRTSTTTTTTSSTTTSTTTEQPNFVADNTEQTSETTINDDAAMKQLTEYDSNIASNSVYEIPTSPEVVLLPGDNIQIIESPQLGQLQKPLTEQKNDTEAATISTTLKVISKPPENVRPALDAPAPVASTPLQQRPPNDEVERQRPPQTIKLQQVKRPNKPTALMSDTKESSIFELKPSNESERPQSNSVATSLSTSSVVKQPLNVAAHEHTDIATGNNDDDDRDDSEAAPTNAGTADFDVDDAWAPATAAVSSAPIAETNMDLQQQHDGGDAHKTDLAATTTVEQTTATTTTTTTTTEATNSASAAESSEEIVAHVEESAPAAQTTPISVTAAASTKPLLRDGQLYQDAVKQEVKPPPNVRGINACPGKEEVVAPFWANNTRGEVLALLNLYPFEQYVHWEKCTHENRQMYCREGCRCEQQYRLHRLLAYDPHNECRGIFSDWFRFPSCCICKCYGIPMEFRATSRSPRSERMNDFETAHEEGDNLEEEFVDDVFVETDEEVEAPQERQHPLDVAERMVRQAIYEHATEDWYRPRDDFDLYEG